MMRRDMPFCVEGVGLTPDGFYEVVQQVIDLFPDEWDAVAVGPEFERNEDGWPTAYLGAGCFFLKRVGAEEKYVAFIVEQHDRLLDAAFREDYVKKVRHAFEQAEAACLEEVAMGEQQKDIESVSGMQRIQALDIARMQQEHDIAMARADLVLRAWRTNEIGRVESILTPEEVRAVLLPALGLKTQD